MSGVFRKLPGLRALFRKIERLESQRLILEEEVRILRQEREFWKTQPGFTYACYDASLTGFLARLGSSEKRWQVWAHEKLRSRYALQALSEDGQIDLRPYTVEILPEPAKEDASNTVLFLRMGEVIQNERWAEMPCRVWCIECNYPDNAVLGLLQRFCQLSGGVLAEWHSPGYGASLGGRYVCTAVILNPGLASGIQSTRCVESFKTRIGRSSPWLRSYVDDIQQHLESNPMQGNYQEVDLPAGCEALTLKANTVGIPSAVIEMDLPAVERKAFVASLRHGAIYTRNGYVLTENNDLLTQTPLIHRGIPQPEEHPLLRKKQRPEERFFKGVSAVLANHSQRNYYHTLIESLPRVVYLHEAGWDESRIDHYILNGVEDDFVLHAAEAVGIPRSKIETLSDEVLFRCEELLVPAMPGTQVMPFGVIQERGYTECPGSPPPRWVVEFLRKNLLPLADKGTGPERLFVNREPGGRRDMANHAEVISILNEFGFVWVQPEKLSFREQIRLFRSARCVAGIHGAALTNLLFTDPGVRFLELFPETYEKTNYRALLQPLEMEYHYLICEAVPNRNGSSRVDDSLRVDTESLRKALKVLTA
ncbi:MAG: glycosyltransferase 61 family protein [Candidatus Methylacidiphilales bacterium]